jgi:hypothetical protein
VVVIGPGEPEEDGNPADPVIEATNLIELLQTYARLTSPPGAASSATGAGVTFTVLLDSVDAPFHGVGCGMCSSAVGIRSRLEFR